MQVELYRINGFNWLLLELGFSSQPLPPAVPLRFFCGSPSSFVISSNLVALFMAKCCLILSFRTRKSLSGELTRL